MTLINVQDHPIVRCLRQTMSLKNLFKLVSISHMNYFYRVPRIPRLLMKYRKGLLVGSACDKGEVFEGLMQKSMEEVEEIAQFYDYLELQPKPAYSHLIEMELIRRRMES